jgi:ribosomal protein L37AE/L43A
MDNVPEHLMDLATWICQKCTNTAAKPAALADQLDEPLQKPMVRRPKKAA